jgi:hypothetical protein
MGNRNGVRTEEFANKRQILANVDLQASVGCIIPENFPMTTVTNGRRFVKAGMPFTLNLLDRETPVTPNPVGGNVILLHDVDITDGDANGTALVFGFVKLSALESQTQAIIQTNTGATLITVVD